MDVNFVGKNMVELDVATFPTKKAAEFARKSTVGGRRTSVVSACNRFFKFYIIVDSRPDMLPGIRMLTWLTQQGTWQTHAHPGFISGNQRISV